MARARVSSEAGSVKEVRPAELRIRQGLALLAGATVFALVVGPAPDRFYLTPLGLGLIYLVAAALGGRRGGYWATTMVLLGWGGVVFWAQVGQPDLDFAGLYLAGAGLGAVLGVCMSRVGFAVDALGLASTIALAGVLLALSVQWPQVIEEVRLYALAVGLVGLTNVVLGVIGASAGPGGGRRLPELDQVRDRDGTLDGRDESGFVS